jgi:hypothetical protein
MQQFSNKVRHIFIVILLQVFILSKVSANDLNYVYLYVQISEFGGMELKTINPLSLNAPNGGFIANKPSSAIYRVDVSPDGEKIVVLFNDDLAGPIFQYMNIENQTTTPIIRFPVMTDLDFISAAWSPDSQYYAYENLVRASDGNSSSLVQIYSVVAQQNIVPFFPDTGNRITDLAWSHDSLKLAIVEKMWSNTFSVYNANKIDVLDITQQKIVSSGIFTFEEGAGLNICQTLWSPDGNIISFFAECPEKGTLPYLPKEIYLHDVILANSAIKALKANPLTNLAAPIMEGTTHEVLPSVVYDTIWFDANTLLLGAKLVGIFDNNIDSENFYQITQVYNVIDQTHVDLMPAAVSDWALNPINSHLLAYRRTEYGLGDSTWPEGKIWANNLTDFVEISTFDGQNLQMMMSLPAGERLQWSPDGRFLAYRVLNEEDKPIKMIFVDIQTQTFTEYLLPQDETIAPSGWVKTFY